MNLTEILANIDKELLIYKQNTNAPLAPVSEAMLPLATILGNGRGDYVKRKTQYELDYDQQKAAKEKELIATYETQLAACKEGEKLPILKVTDAELKRYADGCEDVITDYKNYKESEEIKERLGVIRDSYVFHVNNIKSDRNNIIDRTQ